MSKSVKEKVARSYRLTVYSPQCLLIAVVSLLSKHRRRVSTGVTGKRNSLVEQKKPYK